jgi:hypothetical protein
MTRETMIQWLRKWWNPAAPGTPREETVLLQSLLEERRRLQETRTSYHEFGFDDLARGAREEIRLLTERIRSLHPPDP